ncbi:TPA: HEPN domain-containing protein [Candidatus Micrarchaeota archaeon]|nr:HEPN domain-containing protein [Candidatus Micrarchaeota archaeon]HIH29998.1 HEPN domain-containing protein [Candidatus Micrarchaeota archaeon]
MIDFDSCVAQGLLRKIAPSKVQAEEQLKKAAVLLSEAKSALENDMPNSAVIGGYSAMLDAARAVLFRDGWREKSHACVASYLRARYGKEVGVSAIDLFDEYRDKRHKTMYSGDYYPDAEEAERVVGFAEEFLQKIPLLLKR